MRVLNHNGASHQHEFECPSCQKQGYIQCEDEMLHCPICGVPLEEGDGYWEAEFIIVDELPDPDVVVVTKEKIVYRDKDPDDKRYRYRGPQAPAVNGRRGIRRDINHTIVNTPPVITSMLKDNEVRKYTVDCGYSGERANTQSHLIVWHGMSLEEAKTVVMIGNHDAVDNRTPVRLCDNDGAHPINVEVVGFELFAEERRYRFRIKECGYTSARSTILKHIINHHGYIRKEASQLINLRAGNVDTSKLETPPSQVCNNVDANPVTGELLGHKVDAGGTRRYRFRIKECGYEGFRPSVVPHLVTHHGYSKEGAAKVISFRFGNVDVTKKEVRL